MEEQAELKQDDGQFLAVLLGLYGLVLGLLAALANLAIVGLGVLVHLLGRFNSAGSQQQGWFFWLSIGGLVLGVALFKVSLVILAARRLKTGLGAFAVALGLGLSVISAVSYASVGGSTAMWAIGLPGLFTLMAAVFWAVEPREG